MAQTAAMKATTEAARLIQAIRRLATNDFSIRIAPSSNALRTADPFIRAASSSNNAVCYPEPPAARRLSSAVPILSPVHSSSFDYDQAPLRTQSAISGVPQHFLQAAPFVIATGLRADLSDQLTARVPSLDGVPHKPFVDWKAPLPSRFATIEAGYRWRSAGPK